MVSGHCSFSVDCKECILNSLQASGPSPKNKKPPSKPLTSSGGGAKKGAEGKKSGKQVGNGEVAVDDPASSTPKKAAKDTSRKRKTEESSPAPPAANQESPVCVKRAKTAKDNNRDLGLCRYAPRACSYSSSIKTSTCYPSVSLTLLQLLPSTVVTVSRRCFLFSSEHGSSVIFFCDQVLQIAPNKGGRNSKLPSGRKLLKATATPCPCLTTCVCVCSTGCFLLSWSGIRTRGRFSRQST